MKLTSWLFLLFFSVEWADDWIHEDRLVTARRVEPHRPHRDDPTARPNPTFYSLYIIRSVPNICTDLTVMTPQPGQTPHSTAYILSGQFPIPAPTSLSGQFPIPAQTSLWWPHSPAKPHILQLIYCQISSQYPHRPHRDDLTFYSLYIVRSVPS